ncbi:sensor histidine kinase [Bacteroidota bacterium]
MRTGRISYQLRIFIYFLIAFALFTISILAFQYQREKQYKVELLETQLEVISGFTNGYIKTHRMLERDDFSGLDTISSILPVESVRITIIDPDGIVKYDSFVPDYTEMENHIMRPEVQKAHYSDVGSNIRHSATTGQDFYYFARNYDDYFVRCAVVYNIKVIGYLKTERVFIFFIIALFTIFGILLYVVTNRLGLIIRKLSDFSVLASNNEDISKLEEINDKEFGDIQNQIIQIFTNLKSTQDELRAEKERLSNHLLALDEGIAFFTPGKEKILANSNFIRLVNLISNHSSVSAENIFEIEDLKEFVGEIQAIISTEEVITPKNHPVIKHTLFKNEQYFSIQGIVFADRSFEILISDVTKPEKRRRLKQQLTSNIAHELKTPLASIKGYLETIINNPDIEKDKSIHFVKKAFLQSERLNVLLNDISLLNNIEDAGNLFEFKEVKIKPLITDILENLEARIKKNAIDVKVSVGSKVKTFGNDNLIVSIFQNLIENSINYGGKGIDITIDQYLEDEKFFYFRYSDSGPGVDEKHLPRLFERFYRVDEGRTRDEGGTGLGLAIVKNAIQMHKGEVSVRNGVEGGLEFYFSLAKY